VADEVDGSVELLEFGDEPVGVVVLGGAKTLGALATKSGE
jgi:hypothetical protein